MKTDRNNQSPSITQMGNSVQSGGPLTPDWFYHATDIREYSRLYHLYLTRDSQLAKISLIGHLGDLGTNPRDSPVRRKDILTLVTPDMHQDLLQRCCVCGITEYLPMLHNEFLKDPVTYISMAICQNHLVVIDLISFIPRQHFDEKLIYTLYRLALSSGKWDMFRLFIQLGVPFRNRVADSTSLRHQSSLADILFASPNLESSGNIAYILGSHDIRPHHTNACLIKPDNPQIIDYYRGLRECQMKKCPGLEKVLNRDILSVVGDYLMYG